MLAETAASAFAGLIVSAVLLIALRPKPTRKRGVLVEPDTYRGWTRKLGINRPAVENPIEAWGDGHRL